jgi:hypothetical protein
MVGGDPLTGDVNLLRSLKGADYETIRSHRLGFEKAVDVTKAGVPKGDERLAQIQAMLSTALHALGGADGYAYLRAHVFGGALSGLSEQQFRNAYLIPTFGTTPQGGINAESIQLSPILPEDDQFRFDLIEGRRNRAGAIADPTPPFTPYPANINQDPPGDGNPFKRFESRWYGRSAAPTPR